MSGMTTKVRVGCCGFLCGVICCPLTAVDGPQASTTDRECLVLFFLRYLFCVRVFFFVLSGAGRRFASIGRTVFPINGCFLTLDGGVVRYVNGHMPIRGRVVFLCFCTLWKRVPTGVSTRHHHGEVRGVCYAVGACFRETRAMPS